MASDSGQRFIQRNRPPRVQISYEDPHDANRRVELPFVMGVMADLSGNAPGREKPPVGERTFEQVDMETFDDLMAKLKPGVRFAAESTLKDESTSKDGGGDRLSVELDFQSMDDFSPAAVARKVPPLRKLLEARQQLSNLRSYMTGRVQAEDLLQKLLSDPALMAAIKDRRAGIPAVAGADGEGAERGSDAEKPGGHA
ncbi:type VI secretion system contractile sheath small subunit [Aurantimonas sp. 22II-16-19i]|uniref:type VI secretion system contractile sheath small subunit n=1 Tax=Aurantimonas sp. 22II-16-19i TaxID=1317114 RepID=UPI0009F7BEFB|nr:type VI secretion system contractile sheath small subunit [Aurantimonas sp. 22II-16-19i]ORE92838.1 type VI secretion protein [Aurantimonas sp. 22II-16-19i]